MNAATLKLALRNLLRNRRRSLTTLLAMVIGLGAILTFGGYSRNAVLGMETGFIQLHGHLQIQRQGYFLYGSGNPASYGIRDYQALIERLNSDAELGPMLSVITPKLELGGLAGHFAANQSTPVAATGIEAEGQAALRRWDDYGAAMYAAQMDLSGSPANAVIIGHGVARKLLLCGPLRVSDCPPAPEQEPAGNAAALPADIAALSQAQPRAGDADPVQIEMLAASLRGAPNVVGLTVLRAENFGLKEFDDRIAVMHLSQAQKLVYGASQAQVTALQIQLKHSWQLPAARARLAALLKQQPFALQPLEALDFMTLAPMYRQSLEFFDSMFGFIAVLIGVIVLFTVGNTMSTAVIERTAEIGTLRAIGERRSGVRCLFLGEGLLLGLIGVTLGLIAALIVSALVNRAGLSWTPPGYVYAYPIKVRLLGDWGLLGGSALGLLGVALLSAWWPAQRAARMQIVDALRHV
ncbi:ABC transporter permease [Paucibacter soli]|uniref:ABC transporter permease n=1 Tax=Paucibacter soli TaxID=3133433 RepID=UPI0030A6F4E3